MYLTLFTSVYGFAEAVYDIKISVLKNLIALYIFYQCLLFSFYVTCLAFTNNGK